jgi:hypothetical protein
MAGGAGSPAKSIEVGANFLNKGGIMVNGDYCNLLEQKGSLTTLWLPDAAGKESGKITMRHHERHGGGNDHKKNSVDWILSYPCRLRAKGS